jgi:acyl carrier protein
MTMPATTKQTVKSREELQADLVGILAKRFRVEPEEIDIYEHLGNYGLDSLDAMMVASELSEACGHDITFDELWEYPSVDKIVDYIVKELNQQ